MSDQELEAQDTKQDRFPDEESIGDSSHPETMETDLNGARTAVGVPHPENRTHNARGTGENEDVVVPELDDYDEETPADVPLDSA